ncbi:MAG: N-acetylmuramoyl-L-alanine amidase family protein [Massiliimalia sp.]|jgi:hypothetical protein
MKKAKKITAVLLALMLAASAGTSVVWAASSETSGTGTQAVQISETVYDLSQGKVTITHGGNYRITGQGTQGIVVNTSEPIVLTLENVSVESKDAALTLDGAGKVTLNLLGKNQLKSSDGDGIWVKDSNLIIQEDGELKVSGKERGIYVPKGSTVECLDGTLYIEASSDSGSSLVVEGVWNYGSNIGYPEPGTGNAVVYLSKRNEKLSSGSIGYAHGIVFEESQGQVWGRPHVEAGETLAIPQGKQLEFIKGVLTVDVGGKLLYGGDYGKVTDPQRIIDQNQSLRWEKDATGWRYLKEDGTYATASREFISGKWYYFSETGYMVTGWKEIDGKCYYMDHSGAMLCRWNKLGDDWYYFNQDGSMYTGWQYAAPGSNIWYYLGEDGKMKTGFAKIDGKTYLFDSNGRMQYRWHYTGGSWYFFGSNGVMVTGWQKIDGNWYCFDSFGRMYAGEKAPGGYTMEEDGAWNGTLTAGQAVDVLENSISYQNGDIVFTVPQGYADSKQWNIQIYGRTAAGNGGMSVHFLEEENESRSWQPGKQYTLDLEDGQYQELTLEVQIDSAPWYHSTVNLLDRIPKAGEH